MKTMGHDCRLVLPAIATWLVVVGGANWLKASCISACVMLACSLIARLRGGKFAATYAVIALCTLCASLTTITQTYMGTSRFFSEVIAQRLPVKVIGTIASYPVSRHGNYEFLLRTLVVDIAGNAQEVESWIKVRHVPGNTPLSRFDSVALDGYLDTNEFSSYSHATLTANNIRVLRRSSGWYRYVNKIHHALLSYSASTRNQHDALIPGIAVGDDSTVPRAMKEQMRFLGLSHLTAVSGAHVSIIIGLVVICFGRKRALLTGCGSLMSIYLLTTVVGPEPSVSRAMIMGVLLCVGLGRKYVSSAMPLLALSVIYASLTDPLLVTTLGFQLSVVAVAAIVLAGNYTAYWMSTILPSFLSQALAIPMVAGIATAPLIATIQDSVSLWSVVANALIAPVVTPLTILGLAGGAAAALIPCVGTALLACAGLCTWWIEIVVECLPTSPYPPLVGALVNMLCLFILVVVAHKFHKEEQHELNMRY
ncbi:ComEC/Rec2 family competence protein [Arcanobacterium buesumense]|uniref:ComEC/Rec2 family competence protein n=1 Tax=Arcanobacterium buesumense TaxID=2722751 RepID=A0A6H2ELG3_9ACTO|nr:ComEC/Rec2 family competence protein [Arcanobacterium buesumense]QJC21897.1 ComEC/Rec2 family competence protein [Arcanobacterium buesumense]